LAAARDHTWFSFVVLAVLPGKRENEFFKWHNTNTTIDCEAPISTLTSAE
jgi:hypothetical protein